MISLGQARQGGVSRDLTDAHTDVQNLCREYGFPIVLEIRREGDVTRDKLQSIKHRPTQGAVTLYAFPFINNPNQKQVEKGGLREECSALCHVSRAELRESGYDSDDADMIRGTILANGARYRIKEIGLVSTFLNDFLYVTFGLDKI